MSRDGPGQTAADYLTIVLSPGLIMGMVGSLALFLLEICYQVGGPWKERLEWILFSYVFGIVLVARISMMGEIASRAGMYGSFLALATYFGLQSFVEYPPEIRPLSFLISLVLVALVWWCAHRLVWDCTNVNEEIDLSGEGLLHAAGLEDAPVRESDAEDDPPAEPASWWERYRQYRERQKRRRTMGVWIVYFSLAALPLFGLGQSLIPPGEVDRRRYAFWLMTVYVGCGLGLLLTTSFLGLRRYLRQRRLQMPVSMTATWVVIGGSMLVVLLAMGALLPRPHPEVPILGLFDPAGSERRTANRVALKGDSATEGKGNPGEAGPKGKDGDGKPGEKGKDSDSEKGKGDGQGRKGSGGQVAKGGQQSGQQRGNGDRSQKGQPGEKGQEGQRPAGSRLEAIRQAVERITPVLRWIVFALLALIALFAVLRGFLGFLGGFTDWARGLVAAWRSLWDRLFGSRPTTEEGTHGERDGSRTPEEPPVPFSQFAHPFETGAADRQTTRALVRYTFAAVEAWAREHAMGRRPHETGQEFLERLALEVPALETDARRLAALHARTEYAPGGLPVSTREVLRGFWDRFDQVVESPLSA